MAENWLIRHTVDLAKGGGSGLDGGVLMLPGDNQGHTWQITALREGKAASLTGGSVTGYFGRSDGKTVVVRGGVTGGNMCAVTLTQECYACPGPLRGVMRLTLSGQTFTLADAAFRVRPGVGDDLINGGSAVPTLDDLLAQIQRMEEDTAAAEAVTGKIYPMMELRYEDKHPQKNLFDADHYMNVRGSRLNAWGGLITDANTGVYGVSAYIPVTPGRHYLTELGLYAATERVCFYDANLTPLAAATAIVYPATQVFAAPEGAAAMRATYRLTSAEADGVWIEEYAPQGVNLFNAYSHFTTDNRYLRRNTADTGMQWNRNDSWGMSYYIPVSAGAVYRMRYTGASAGPRAIVYDAELNYLAELYESSVSLGTWWTLTMPAGAAYIRIPYAIARRYSMAELAAGSAAPELYEPYRGIEEGRGAPFKACLPDTIYCAVGRTIEIYNAQVVLRPERFTLRWICDTGYAYGRKFSVTGTAETVGAHALTLQVLDSRGRMLYSKTARLVIAGQMSAAKRMLVIGDSLTKCDKPVIPELVNLSGGKIVPVGTQTGTARDANGVSRTTYSEARSGWSPLRFLSNSNSPFVVSGAFNWANYVSGLESAPQAVTIMLGTNGLGQYPRLTAGWIVEIVQGIRDADGNIPIFVAHTIYRSSQDGIGAETGSDGYTSGTVGAAKDIEDEKILDLMAETERQLSEAGLTAAKKVYTVGVGISMDAEYNFGLRAVAVNPRNTALVEYIPTESIHPQACGYHQIADVLYSAYCARL